MKNLKSLVYVMKSKFVYQCFLVLELDPLSGFRSKILDIGRLNTHLEELDQPSNYYVRKHYLKSAWRERILGILAIVNDNLDSQRILDLGIQDLRIQDLNPR